MQVLSPVILPFSFKALQFASCVVQRSCSPSFWCYHWPSLLQIARPRSSELSLAPSPGTGGSSKLFCSASPLTLIIISALRLRHRSSRCHSSRSPLALVALPLTCLRCRRGNWLTSTLIITFPYRLQCRRSTGRCFMLPTWLRLSSRHVAFNPGHHLPFNFV